MNSFERFISKLGQIDRRYLFLLIAAAVLVPLIRPIGLPVRATQATQDVFDAVNALPKGSRVLISFDYGPSTKPEIYPMTVALLRHLFKNKHKVYTMSLWPDGVFMSLEALSLVAEKDFGAVYGEDYVRLGFRPGNEAVIKGVVSDLRKVYTVDTRDTFLNDIPMMAGISNINNFAFLFSASSGYPGTIEWIQYASDVTDIKISTGTTSIQVNELIPYVQSGQLKGILAGMPGAAEYETLIRRPGVGTSGMDAQSIAHLVIVAFIILGNFGYYLERRRKRKYR